MEVLISRTRLGGWDRLFRIPRPRIFIVFIRACIYNFSRGQLVRAPDGSLELPVRSKSTGIPPSESTYAATS